MKIAIKTVKQSDQRYCTCDDWKRNGDTMEILVSEMGDDEMNFLIAIHAMIEAFLCERDGVKEEDVTKFDMENMDLDNPGDNPKAPYNKQHLIATLIECQLASYLGIPWKLYEERISEICQ